MFSRYLRAICAPVLAICVFMGQPLAGPPLTTDDPGITDFREWEIIAAATGATSDAVDVYQLPLLDISYGLTPNTELSASLPYVFADVAGARSDNDLGNLAVGFKWQFLNRENVQLSFAPIFAFGIRASAAQRGVGADDGILFLPVNFQYTIGGEWTVIGEFGYASVKNNADALGYGVAFGHPIGRRTQILFEIFGASETDFAEDNLNFHVGFDIELNPRLHWLMAFGSGLSSPDDREELDFDFYLGVQYFTAGRQHRAP